MNDLTLQRRKQKYEDSRDKLFVCKDCNQEKLGSEFYPALSRSRAIAYICKSCLHERTNALHTNMTPEERKERSRQANKRRKTAKQQTQRKKTEKRKISNHDKPAKALPRSKIVGNIIHWSIRAGIIDRPTTCSVCGGTGRIEAHHANPICETGDLTIEHVFDITWLCRKCHHQLHMENGDYIKWWEQSNS